MESALKALCVALVLLYLSRRAGHSFMKVLRVRTGRGPESAIIETGAGAWLVSLAILALGAAGLWQARAIWGLLGVAAVAFLVHDTFVSIKKSKEDDAAPAGEPAPRPAWAPAAWVVLAAAAAANLVRCLAPPTAFDALSYHFAVPKLYLAEGTVKFLPTIPYSNFPLTAEMLFLPALAAGSPAAASMLHAGFGLMTAAMLFFWARRNFSLPAALVSAVVFYLTPLVSLESPTAMIDLVATFYAAVAVMCLAPEKPAGDGADSAAAAALFAGIAVSVKWSCAIVPAIAVVLLLLRHIAGKREIKISPARLMLLSALFVAPSLPYLVKNFILAGNPVWPVLAGVFGGRDIDPGSAARLIAHIKGHAGLGHSFAHLLRLPWDMTMSEWSFEGAISQTFLCFVPLYILVRKNRNANFLLAFSLAYIPLWFMFLNLSLRFFLPVIPLLAAAVGHIVTELPGRSLRLLAGCALAVQLCFSLLTSQVGESGLANDFRVIAGRESRENYKTRHMPEYELYKWINANAGPDDRVMLGEILNKGYYLDVPYAWGHPVFQARYRYDRMRGGDDLLAALREDGITFIVFRFHREVTDAYDLKLPLMNAHSQTVWRDFLKDHTAAAYSTEKGVVFRLSENPDSIVK
ncbi:MAG: phospholipid carrier-dependent glycosyltransferase [bacterium]